MQGKGVSPPHPLTQGSSQCTMAAQGPSRQAFWDLKQPEKQGPLEDQLKEEICILYVFFSADIQLSSLRMTTKNAGDAQPSEAISGSPILFILSLSSPK